MASEFHLSSAAAQGMLNGTALAESVDAGTGAVINIYDGTAPSDADAALSGNTQLAQLACASPAFASFTDTGTAARATFDTIADDASADDTGQATFFRILTEDAGTVIGQGNVGTTDEALVLNTDAITSGSTVSITSAWIDLPKGP